MTGDSRSPVVIRVLVPLVLCLHVTLLAWSAYVHSPTLNEPGHLAAGVSNWQFGRFDVYSVNPPLVRMVAASPVLLAGPETDWRSFHEGVGARPEFHLGSDFIAANGERSMWLLTLARWACIPFSALGGYVCYRWGRELYGAGAGVLSLTLWCFCPNILGHGPLITSDVAATALSVAAGYTFWHWLKCPTWWHTIVSGLVLGIAELAKTTLIVFYPLWPVMWLIYRWPKRSELRSRDWLHEATMLLARMAIVLYVINLGYGFEGTLTRLGEYQFVSAALGAEPSHGLPRLGGNRFSGTWLESLPIPLPKHYCLGIDLQKKDIESYHRPSYLRGRFSPKGWWYYYLYALAIKVPIGTWGLIGMATIARLGGRNAVAGRDEFVVLAPAAIILTFVSSQTGFSEHLRYVLPVFPFVMVWIGRVTTLMGPQHRIANCFATAALTWSICSSLWIYPHSLSYFNEWVGGPKGGPAHLIHSNVDWGQDLLQLKYWLKTHPEVRPLNLFCFGYFNPRHAGLEYTVPERLLTGGEEPVSASQIPPGWYAVSVNFIRGYPWSVYRPDGSEVQVAQNKLTAFQGLKPAASAGYSTYIYHVTSQATESREDQ